MALLRLGLCMRRTVCCGCWWVWVAGTCQAVLLLWLLLHLVLLLLPWMLLVV